MVFIVAQIFWFTIGASQRLSNTNYLLEQRLQFSNYDSLKKQSEPAS